MYLLGLMISTGLVMVRSASAAARSAGSTSIQSDSSPLSRFSIPMWSRPSPLAAIVSSAGLSYSSLAS